MPKVFRWASESGRFMRAQLTVLRTAYTDITAITRTPVRPMATMDLTGSLTDSSSEPAPGTTAIMGAAILMAAGTGLGVATMGAISKDAATTDAGASAERVFAVNAASVAAQDVATSVAASVVVNPMVEADTEAEAARMVVAAFTVAEAAFTVVAEAGTTVAEAGTTVAEAHTAEGTGKGLAPLEIQTACSTSCRPFAFLSAILYAARRR